MSDELAQTGRAAGDCVDGDDEWKYVRVLTGAEYAEDAVAVDADAISGVGLHGDGLVVAMTWWSSL